MEHSSYLRKTNGGHGVRDLVGKDTDMFMAAVKSKEESDPVTKSSSRKKDNEIPYIRK